GLQSFRRAIDGGCQTRGTRADDHDVIHDIFYLRRQPDPARDLRDPRRTHTAAVLEENRGKILEFDIIHLQQILCRRDQLDILPLEGNQVPRQEFFYLVRLRRELVADDLDALEGRPVVILPVSQQIG